MAKKLEYQLFMEENSINVKELPKELKDKINGIKMSIGKFNASKPPNAKLKETVERQDLEISQLLADWLEKELPEPNANDDNDDAAAAEAAALLEVKAKEDAIAAEAKAKEDAAAAEVKAKEDAIAAEAKAKADAEAAVLAEAEAVAKAKADADAAKKPITNFGTIEMENTILDECKARNGYIETSKLEGIIKKSPSYPEQAVYSITLRKVFLKGEYKLQ